MRVSWKLFSHVTWHVVGARSWVYNEAHLEAWFEPNTICLFLWSSHQFLCWQVFFPTSSCYRQRCLGVFFETMFCMAGMAWTRTAISYGLLCDGKTDEFVALPVICQESRQVICMGTDVFHDDLCIPHGDQGGRSTVWVLQGVNSFIELREDVLKSTIDLLMYVHCKAMNWNHTFTIGKASLKRSPWEATRSWPLKLFESHEKTATHLGWINWINCRFGPNCWVTLPTAFRPKIPHSKDIPMVQTRNQEHPKSIKKLFLPRLCASQSRSWSFWRSAWQLKRSLCKAEHNTCRCHESKSYRHHMAPHQLETPEHPQYVEAPLNNKYNVLQQISIEHLGRFRLFQDVSGSAAIFASCDRYPTWWDFSSSDFIVR